MSAYSGLYPVVPNGNITITWEPLLDEDDLNTFGDEVEIGNARVVGQTNTYTEIDSRLGAHIVWNNAHVIYQERTHRDTLVEFVERPQWGVACFMNGTIQSCESDEYIYHRNLVDPCFRSSMPDDCRVAIFGGGEWANAREVLKYDCVENVDMFICVS